MFELIGFTFSVGIVLYSLYKLNRRFLPNHWAKFTIFSYALIILTLSYTCYKNSSCRITSCEPVEEVVDMDMVSNLDFSYLHTSEINDSLLYLVLNYYNVSDPKYVLAQSKLESGNFTSNIFKTNNNLLGLYNSKDKCYYSFSSWQDCIKGYVSSIQYKKQENEDHIAFLRRIKYAEDPAYIHKINEIYKKLNSFLESITLLLTRLERNSRLFCCLAGE